MSNEDFDIYGNIDFPVQQTKEEEDDFLKAVSGQIKPQAADIYGVAVDNKDQSKPPAAAAQPPVNQGQAAANSAEEEVSQPTVDLSAFPDPGIKLVLHIKNMLYYTTDRKIEALVAPYGKVKKIRFIEEKRNGKSTGECYVKFYDSRSAQIAATELQGRSLDGKEIEVDLVPAESLKALNTHNRGRKERREMQMQKQQQVQMEAKARMQAQAEAGGAFAGNPAAPGNPAAAAAPAPANAPNARGGFSGRGRGGRGRGFDRPPMAAAPPMGMAPGFGGYYPPAYPPQMMPGGFFPGGSGYDRSKYERDSRDSRSRDYDWDRERDRDKDRERDRDRRSRSRSRSRERRRRRSRSRSHSRSHSRSRSPEDRHSKRAKYSEDDRKK